MIANRWFFRRRQSWFVLTVVVCIAGLQPAIGQQEIVALCSSRSAH
jgi:hypothetical protein